VHRMVLTWFERYALERTFLTDGDAIGVASRQHETAQFLGARAGKDIRDGLLMDIPQHEVPTAINNAAHNVTVRMHTCELAQQVSQDWYSLTV
jgi:hypothetical protein